MLRYFIHIAFVLLSCHVEAQVTRVVVDASGHGDYLTVQEAINSLPDDAPAPRVIFIRKGTYREKVFVGKNNLVLEGEDKDQTILTFSLARDAWRCDHADDWGVATLNLRGSDITLKNLSIVNSYGFDNTAGQVEIACPADSRTVLRDCSFSGYDGFKLGRYHRDAQFYLIHCRFAANMADQDIYLVATTNTIRWGRRVYYYDCHKKGQEYSWYADNLTSAPGAPDAAGINPHWVFRDKWDPEKEAQP